jgi:hypothetical protein
METIQSELRIDIPKRLLEGFAANPRIVCKPCPGLWPVDMRVLKHLEKLMDDKEFNSKFEVIVTPR